MYEKTGGKNGRHQAITKTSNISALSYLALQVYEEARFCTFSSIPTSTAQLQTFQFMHLPPHQVLTVLQHVKISDNSGVKLMQEEWGLYQELSRGLKELQNAMAAFQRKETKR